jgi:hypothetical protein
MEGKGGSRSRIYRSRYWNSEILYGECHYPTSYRRKCSLSKFSRFNNHTAELLRHLQGLPLKRLELSLVRKIEEEEDEEEDNEEEEDEGAFYTNLDTLAIVQEHPSLCELSIKCWDNQGLEDIRKNRSFTLPGITSLWIDGDTANKASVKAITELCPSLSHVHLSNVSGRRVDYGNVLPHLPTSLHSLSLRATLPNVSSCDPYLPRFTSLRSIDLGNKLFSSSIDRVLSQLPLLEKIKLGYGTINLDRFSSLIHGPVRLQHLRQVDLNLYPAIFGLRVAPSNLDRIKAVGFQAPRPREGWSKRLEDPNDWQKIEKDLAGLVKVGKKNGIVVNADIAAFDKYRQAYDLEIHNRSVLVAFCRRSPHLIATAQLLARDRSWLPLQADLDSLDPERLELVETPVPELNWFVFSLKNKDTEVVQRDGE